LIFDGWSFDIFLRELDLGYVSLKEGRSGGLSPDDALKFSDYTTWLNQQQGTARDSEIEEFWTKRLQALPEPVRWNASSVDAPVQLGTESRQLSKEQSNAYGKFCRENDLKISDFFLAAFVLALSRASSRDRVVVQIAHSGRTLPEVSSIIGAFYTNLPLCVDLSDGFREPSLPQLIADEVSAVVEHADISDAELEKLAASADAGYVVDFTYSYQDARLRNLSIGDLQLEQLEIARPDLSGKVELWIKNTAAGVVLNLDYVRGAADEELFPALFNDIISACDKIQLGQAADMDSTCHGHWPHSNDLSGKPPKRRGLRAMFGRPGS
jgi:hypothetical protein